MAVEQSINFGSDGNVEMAEKEFVSAPAATGVPSLPPADDNSGEGIDRILILINDPEVALADITRLIALEIAKLMKKMTDIGNPLAVGYTSQRDLNDQVKAYRELQKTLMESDTLSKKDTLNLDGPKFKFVFTEINKMFKQALQDSEVDDALIQNILLQYGDLVKKNEENLRRELNKIEAGR